jgi:hypothetical protein
MLLSCIRNPCLGGLKSPCENRRIQVRQAIWLGKKNVDLPKESEKASFVRSYIYTGTN